MVVRDMFDGRSNGIERRNSRGRGHARRFPTFDQVIDERHGGCG